MSKFCVKCGKEMDDSARMCPNCGAPVSNNRIQRREVVTAIILSLVTCGIYGIYWFICLTNDANTVNEEPNATNGGMAFLYTLITCGIYSFYWNYKMGKKLYEAGKKRNIDIADNSILYIILAVFGLSIVNYCILQSDLNKFAD